MPRLTERLAPEGWSDVKRFLYLCRPVEPG